MSALPRIRPGFRLSEFEQVERLTALTALLFSGFQPFLTLFFHSRGFSATSIGIVLAFGGFVRLAAAIPFGLVVDRSRNAQAWLLLAGLLAAGAPLLLLPRIPSLAHALVATGLMTVAEVVVAPAILAMCLDGIPPDALVNQFGRNQAVGHFGKVVGLSLSAMIGSEFGFSALIVCESIYFAMLLMLASPLQLTTQNHRPRPIVGERRIAPLMVLGLSLALFHLGNTALPSELSLSLASSTRISASLLASGVALIAQAAMVLGSLVAVPALRRWSYRDAITLSYAVLPLRCLLAMSLPACWAIVPVELLHGLGAGIQTVAVWGAIVELRVADERAGTSLGFVMALQGIGGACSQVIGGYLVDGWGMRVAYAAFGVFGICALALWTLPGLRFGKH